MKQYLSLGEALQDMTVVDVDKALNVTEVAYPQDEIKTTVQQEAAQAAKNEIDVVDVGNDVFAAVKRGANETIYTISQSGQEIQTLKQRFDAMSPYGKAAALVGLYFGAKALTKVINPTYAIGGAALYFITTRNK